VSASGHWIVAYSPLGRGFLTNESSNAEGTAARDFRKSHPRFSGDAYEQNLQLVVNLEVIAEENPSRLPVGARVGAVARQRRGTYPGTKRRKWLEENIAASSLILSESDCAALENAVPRGAVVGERYHTSGMTTING